MSAISNLSRVTTEYIPREDRIRLSGLIQQNGSESVCVIWLTQRLLGRLVPLLVKRISPGIDLDQPTSAGSGGAANDPAERAMSGQRTSAQKRSASHDSAVKRLEGEKPEPVRPTEAAQEWLAQSLDLQQSGKGVRLILKQPDGEGAVGLQLTDEQLEQWLGILMDCYLRGEWPIEKWPDWMSANLPGRRANALH